MDDRTTITGEIKHRSGWGIFMGVLILLLGLVLFMFPLATALITTVLIGWILALVGIAEIIFALRSSGAGSFFLKLFTGIVSLAAGVLLAIFPLHGLTALTMILAVALFVEGIALLSFAFSVRPASHWTWFLFDGLITILAAVLILAHWPSSSIWAIGSLVGAAVAIRGITRIMVASRIRRGADTIDRFAHRSV